MTTKNEIVPGVNARRTKKSATAATKAQEKSDLRPRAKKAEAPVAAGIDPARLEQHVQAMEGANHAQVLQAEVHSQAAHAASRPVATQPAQTADGTGAVLNTADRSVIAAVLQEMGILPPGGNATGHAAPATVQPDAVSAPDPYAAVAQRIAENPGAGHTTGNTIRTAARAPYVPPLVSQGLVNVLARLQAMPVELVDAKLNDLAGILALRNGAQTMEARQRYTLMACVQIVQDFEPLWATQEAPLR